LSLCTRRPKYIYVSSFHCYRSFKENIEIAKRERKRKRDREKYEKKEREIQIDRQEEQGKETELPQW
jgi:hypothetical protein